MQCITHPKSIPLIIYPVPPEYTDEALSLLSPDKSKVPTSMFTDTKSSHPGMQQTTKSPLVATPPARSLDSENIYCYPPTERYKKSSLPSATPSRILAPPEPAELPHLCSRHCHPGNKKIILPTSRSALIPLLQPLQSVAKPRSLPTYNLKLRSNQMDLTMLKAHSLNPMILSRTTMMTMKMTIFCTRQSLAKPQNEKEE